MREIGWLQEVFAAASKRVDEWPEWKKKIEARKADQETQEKELPNRANAMKASKASG